MCKKSIRYNWAGDIIVRGTLVDNKRMVIGYKDRFIPTDIREWVKEPPNNKLSEALSEIEELPKTKEAGSFDKRAMLIWDYVARKITYVYDKEAHGLPDFWMLPEEVLTLRKGDCEDSTFLLCSLLLSSGISPFCVRAELGVVYDKKGNPLGGHAFPCYLDEWGNWRLLESTLDKVPNRMPLADSLAKEGKEFRYEPMLCFNRQHLWLVKPSTMDISKYLKLAKVKADKRR